MHKDFLLKKTFETINQSESTNKNQNYCKKVRFKFKFKFKEGAKTLCGGCLAEVVLGVTLTIIGHNIEFKKPLPGKKKKVRWFEKSTTG
jgi:hypothetical protein